MFSISHEVPVQMLEESREFNDYDYALVHIFEKCQDYYDFYKESIRLGRKVILDNSSYELGKPFDVELYREYIDMLQPTEFILPDYRDDAQKNLQAINEWNIENIDLKGSTIGVIHGENYKEFCQNYRDVSSIVDKIAFSVEGWFKDDAIFRGIPYELSRVAILKRMVSDGVIDEDRNHHILGTLSPTEYSKLVDFKWIESADTSNPVLHGLLGQKYDGMDGLREKSKIKMDSIMHNRHSEERVELARYNIRWFKSNLNTKNVEPYIKDWNEKSEIYDEIKGSHYRKQPIETIELMRRVYGEAATAQWCEMTALKYRMRLGHKPSQKIEDDIIKEKWYLEKSSELKENLV